MIARCRRNLAWLTVLVLTGCAQYQLVKADARIDIGGAFSVGTQREWSRIDHGRVELWTVDGPLLEQVAIYKGIEDGENLLVSNPLEEKPKDFPTFENTMTPLEVRDLLEATFARAQEVEIQTFDMKPWKFADADGFRFDYKFTTKSGLRKRGFTVGAIHDEKLFMIVFSAAELYYFDKFATELEKVVSSIERKA